MTYTGPSMNPTLKTPDLLFVAPYQGQKIRSGDVIVFTPPQHRHKVVHRVISNGNRGIKTRGDNNPHLDSWVLSPEHVIGQVVYIQRGHKRQRIFGGMMGRVYAAAGKMFFRIDERISGILYPAYNWLARVGIFHRWLSIRIKTQVLCFSRPAGKEYLLVLGRHVIGQRPPQRNQWLIRRPFRLFIDEASLPHSNGVVKP